MWWWWWCGMYDLQNHRKDTLFYSFLHHASLSEQAFYEYCLPLLYKPTSLLMLCSCSLCFVKCSELAHPRWLAAIVLWWRVLLFTLADGSLLQADGTWLSGFAGGPSICLHQGLSPDNEKGLLHKWLVELKGQYRLIREFTCGNLMTRDSPISFVDTTELHNSDLNVCFVVLRCSFKWLALRPRESFNSYK